MRQRLAEQGQLAASTGSSLHTPRRVRSSAGETYNPAIGCRGTSPCTQLRQQFDKRLFPFADRREIDFRAFEDPVVVGGDFRPADEHAHVRPPLFDEPRDLERPFDVPQIARPADQPRIARQDLGDQPPVGKRIGQPRGKNLDFVMLLPARAAAPAA